MLRIGALLSSGCWGVRLNRSFIYLLIDCSCCFLALHNNILLNIWCKYLMFIIELVCTPWEPHVHNDDPSEINKLLLLLGSECHADVQCFAFYGIFYSFWNNFTVHDWHDRYVYEFKILHHKTRQLCPNKLVMFMGTDSNNANVIEIWLITFYRTPAAWKWNEMKWIGL